MIPFPEIQDQPNFTPPTGGLEVPVFVWVLAGLLLAGGMLAFISWRQKRRRLGYGAPPPAPPLASHVLAMNLLEDLRPNASQLPGRELASRVVEIVRTFLHRQFGVMARYRTAQEILALRQNPNTPPPSPAVREFEDFLLHADSLNYGSAPGPNDRPDALIDEAINVIRRSMDHVHAPRAASAPPPPAHVGLV